MRMMIDKREAMNIRAGRQGALVRPGATRPKLDGKSKLLLCVDIGGKVHPFAYCEVKTVVKIEPSMYEGRRGEYRFREEGWPSREVFNVQVPTPEGWRISFNVKDFHENVLAKQDAEEQRKKKARRG